MFAFVSGYLKVTFVACSAYELSVFYQAVRSTVWTRMATPLSTLLPVTDMNSSSTRSSPVEQTAQGLFVHLLRNICLIITITLYSITISPWRDCFLSVSVSKGEESMACSLSTWLPWMPTLTAAGSCCPQVAHQANTELVEIRFCLLIKFAVKMRHNFFFCNCIVTYGHWILPLSFCSSLILVWLLAEYDQLTVNRYTLLELKQSKTWFWCNSSLHVFDETALERCWFNCRVVLETAACLLMNCTMLYWPVSQIFWLHNWYQWG